LIRQANAGLRRTQLSILRKYTEKMRPIEDEDDDEDSLPDEAFALSTATSVRERSRENEILPSSHHSNTP
jgi:hypothetical protein